MSSHNWLTQRSHTSRLRLLAFLIICTFALTACEEDTDVRSDGKGFDEATLLASREEKSEAYRSSSESPIPEDQRAAFTGLRFFAPSEDYYVSAAVKWLTPPDTIMMVTSVGGDERRVIRAAELTFNLNGHTSKLSGFRFTDATPYEGYLFVPFRDVTNGFTTYEAGRYLDAVASPEDDSIVLDFNLAYHPLCMFNHEYSCPIPPPENTLRYKIEAGEKK